MSAETKFTFHAWSNILPTKRPEAVIEGVLLRGQFGVIFAQPENGKSFVGLGMCLSVGTGEFFAGRAVRKGASIFVAAEAAYALEMRVPAWRVVHPNAPEPLGGCYKQVVNFYQKAEVGAFITELKKQLNGEHLELLVIDTLTASMVGGNQDWSKDMTIFIDNVKMVMEATSCAALVIHHAGWKETSREKGSIDLRGAADVVIETAIGKRKPDGSRIVTLTCRKQRAMREFDTFSTVLNSVTVDTPDGGFECLAVGDLIATPDTDKNFADMEFALETLLKNKGTAGEWLAAIHQYLGTDKDWSSSSFHRRLKVLKDNNRVTGGGHQGAYYSMATAAAEATQEPSSSSAEYNPAAYNPAAPSASNGKSKPPNHYHSRPIGAGSGDSAFDGQSTPMGVVGSGDSGSLKSRKMEKPVVVELAETESPGTGTDNTLAENLELLKKVGG